MWKAAAPVLMLACSACSDMPKCSNDVQNAVVAPDGKFTAILFERSCGATTDFSTQVSVLKAGGRLAEGGNAFVADTDHGAAERAEWGGPWAELTWVTPRHLLVRYDARSRVFTENGEVSGVRVTFEKVTR